MDTCCWFISLKTGSLIIGILSAIVTALELFVLLMAVTLKPVVLTNNRIIIYVCFAIYNCLLFLFSILVVIAAIKRSPVFTLPWTIASGIQCIVYLIICIITLATILQDEQFNGLDFAVLVYFTVRSVFKLYFIFVVHKYHKQTMRRIAEENAPALKRFIARNESKAHGIQMVNNVLENGSRSQAKRLR